LFLFSFALITGHHIPVSCNRTAPGKVSPWRICTGKKSPPGRYRQRVNCEYHRHRVKMKFKRNAKKSPREGIPLVRELPLITPCSIDNYTWHTHFCHSGGGTEVGDQGSMTPSFQLSTNPFWPPLLACPRMHQNTPFLDRKIPNSTTPH